MILTVNEFCEFAQQPATLKRLFKKLQQSTSRNMTDNEVKELSESYPQVARMLTVAKTIDPKFGNVNITSWSSCMVRSRFAWGGFTRADKCCDYRAKKLACQ